jgi:hypothetical protein
MRFEGGWKFYCFFVGLEDLYESQIHPSPQPSPQGVEGADRVVF